MNEITFSTHGNKQYMEEAIARAAYGRFYIVGRKVEYCVIGMKFSEAEDAFTDDLNELKSGNVDFEQN